MAALPPLPCRGHASNCHLQRLTPRRAAPEETAAKASVDQPPNEAPANATSHEQWLITHLREKNRSLEEELTAIVMRREEHYVKQMEEAHKEYRKGLDEKKAEQEQWYETRKREVRELKAAFKIAFSIYMSRKRALHTQILQNESTFKDQLEANKEETESLRREFTAKLDERTKEYSSKIKDLETQLAKITKQADVQATQIRHLEVQLQKERQERQNLITRYEQQLTETSVRKESQRETGPQISDGHLQRHAREIRAIRKRAAMEKQELEKEILSYVRFIMSTQEGRNTSFLEKIDWSEALLRAGGAASARGGLSTSQLQQESADWQTAPLARFSEAGDLPPCSARHDLSRMGQK